jgi:Tol biopolymer transport system component
MSVSADGRSLVTVRAEQRASVWLVPVEGAEPPRVLPGAGADDGVQGIGFAADGKIVYTSTSSGNSDIWIMNADGSNRVQLTTSKSDDLLPAVTPDGRFIIFVSERDGKRALWRMDTSGSSQTRLSDEAVNRSNFGPGVTADSRWVFFTNDKGINLKVDVDGHSLGPIFSADSAGVQNQKATALHDVLPLPDAAAVTGHYTDPTARAERLAIVPIADPSAARLMPTVRNNGLVSGDGRSLVYWDNPRGVGNIWRQAIAGGPAVQLTHFDGSVIFRHALAPDQKHLAVVRGATISDVILIADRPAESSQP